MKKLLILPGIFLALTSCGTSVENTTPTNSGETPAETSEVNSEKIEVSASIVPLASVVNTIGGDYVDTTVIVPAGVSPHGFDLSARQMAKLSNDEIVFMVGLEHIDGFLEKAVDENKQVHLADGMELIEVEGHHHDDDDEEDEHEEDGHHDEEDSHEDEDHHDDEHKDEHMEEGNHDEHDHSSDPHVWLGKENIIQIARQVRDELTSLLPDQKEYFAQNTEDFIAELEAVYSNFENEISEKTPKEFIVFHDAYNYLLQSTGMDMNLKVPFSENVLHEPGTAHMVELIEEVKLHGIKNVFTEPQFSSGNIEKFANEYNLTLGTLDPLGQNANAGGYIENLTNNLSALQNIYE